MGGHSDDVASGAGDARRAVADPTWVRGVMTCDSKEKKGELLGPPGLPGKAQREGCGLGRSVDLSGRSILDAS